ncbi:MAG TPA: ATPase [Clostridiales bacterium]|nr:ATPase [Clostridiales bacterium]
MKEKHIFAGGNTSKGFYSCFDNIFDPVELNHIYILKGGPGVGKSSFMKKFAGEMLKKDYSAEFVHCSSDNESLDGIIIPELKIAIVDGTAPHTLDPQIPGAVDEIVNLGAFIDSNQLKKYKNQIIQTNKNKTMIYKSAYRYLKAAGIISEEINAIHDSLVDTGKFEIMCADAKAKMLADDEDLKKKSKTKRLFSEAYTANGYISHTASLYQGKRIWSVVGENTSYTSELLKMLADEASKRGYDIELYCMPLNPDMLRHIHIPEMNLVITGSGDHAIADSEEVFDIHGIMNTENLKTRVSEIENNLHLFDLLIKIALDKLSETKKYHELLEVFYINSMDFNGVDNSFESILRQYT